MSVLLLISGMLNQAVALDTAFTYQGQLQSSGTTITGTCDLAFKLYDADSGGVQIGSTVEKTGLTITDGLVTTTLDFGAGAFDGNNRWLEIGVRCGAEPSYTTLTPRQALTPTPYALYAGHVRWENITSLPLGFADGLDNDSGGDMTGVTAGDGLTGGGTTGEVTLAVNPAYVQRRVSSSCTTGSSIQSIAEDGTVTCETDDNSGGDITGVTAGAGLTGGATTGEATLSVDPTYAQLRVSSTCPEGQSIRVINADGTVICQTAAAISAPSGNTISTIDNTGDVGMYTSITIGVDGLGLMGYRDVTNNDLKIAHCTDTACTGATISTLDSAGDVGWDTAVTIGTDGLGLISYRDHGNGDLKVAHCTNTTCTSATLATLDSDGDVGESDSVTIGTDGLGLISYHDGSNGNLKVAHCSNTACTSATLSTLDNSVGEVGLSTSVTIGTDGLGLISYYDFTNGNLRVAHCDNTPCTSAALSTLDTGLSGCQTSVTIGTDGLGLISYYDGTNYDLKVAHCNNTACTGATITTLDSAGSVGLYLSVAIGSDGLGLISYRDGTTNDLKVAHCNNTTCSSATIITLDNTNSITALTSVTIGMDGLGLISYYGGTSGNLKVAHCSNVFCIPYFLRR